MPPSCARPRVPRSSWSLLRPICHRVAMLHFRAPAVIAFSRRSMWRPARVSLELPSELGCRPYRPQPCLLAIAFAALGRNMPTARWFEPPSARSVPRRGGRSSRSKLFATTITPMVVPPPDQDSWHAASRADAIFIPDGADSVRKCAHLHSARCRHQAFPLLGRGCGTIRASRNARWRAALCGPDAIVFRQCCHRYKWRYARIRVRPQHALRRVAAGGRRWSRHRARSALRPRC